MEHSVDYEDPTSLLIKIECKDKKILYNSRELLLSHSATIRNRFDLENSDNTINIPFDSSIVILFFKWITSNIIPDTIDDKISLLTITDFLDIRDENRLCLAICNSFDSLKIKADNIIEYMEKNFIVFDALNLTTVLTEHLTKIIEITAKEKDEDFIARNKLKDRLYDRLHMLLGYGNTTPKHACISVDDLIHRAKVFIDTCSNRDKVNVIQGMLNLLDDDTISIADLNTKVQFPRGFTIPWVEYSGPIGERLTFIPKP